MKTLNVKVEQFNGINGPVKNQFVIRTSQGTFFQSYRSVIAFRPFGGGKIQIDKDYWDYSKTTGKYRNQFLNETRKETEEKIKNGVYLLKSLN
ncbi:MAG: hypothetical protein ABSA76_06255 [Bacteroidales bacterium]